MKKALQSKTIYEPNPNVKVTVVNKPVFDETGKKIGYDAKVTVAYLAKKLDEVTFTSDDDIAEFVGAIDFTDPQQQLLKDE